MSTFTFQAAEIPAQVYRDHLANHLVNNTTRFRWWCAREALVSVLCTDDDRHGHLVRYLEALDESLIYGAEPPDRLIREYRQEGIPMGQCDTHSVARMGFMETKTNLAVSFLEWGSDPSAPTEILHGHLSVRGEKIELVNAVADELLLEVGLRYLELGAERNS